MRRFGHLREKSPLHVPERDEVRTDPEPLGKLETKAVQEGRLIGIRLHHAAKAELATIGHREHHIGALDAVEFGEDGPRTLAEPRTALPLLEGLPTDVRQEADEDMRLHPRGPLVPDGRSPSSLFWIRKAASASVSWM